MKKGNVVETKHYDALKKMMVDLFSQGLDDSEIARRLIRNPVGLGLSPKPVGLGFTPTAGDLVRIIREFMNKRREIVYVPTECPCAEDEHFSFR